MHTEIIMLRGTVCHSRTAPGDAEGGSAHRCGPCTKPDESDEGICSEGIIVSVADETERGQTTAQPASHHSAMLIAATNASSSRPQRPCVPSSPTPMCFFKTSSLSSPLIVPRTRAAMIREPPAHPSASFCTIDGECARLTPSPAPTSL